MNRTEKLQWLQDQCIDIEREGEMFIAVMADGKDIMFGLMWTISHGKVDQEFIAWESFNKKYRTNISNQAKDNVRKVFVQYRRKYCCKRCNKNIGRIPKILQRILIKKCKYCKK